MNATVTPEIAAFAAAVRAELGDLPADEVDDIVDGLESDLAEQAAERGDDFVVPDAAAYATELRQAAGLPDRPTGISARQAFGEQLRTLGARAVRRIRSNRAGAWLLDLFLALRPVWWLARGYALYMFLFPVSLGSFFPRDGFGWLVLLALLLLSVQWGRGRWAPRAWLRGLRTVLSTLAVLALPFLIGGAVSQVGTAIQLWTYGYPAYAETDPVQPGLAVDGERIRNIFAYDAEGNPLTDVQLFDQDGRPLTTVGTRSHDASSPVDDYFFGGGGPAPVAITAPGRAPTWNVFPLAELAPDEAEPDPDLAAAATPPFAQVPSIQRLTAPDPQASDGPDPQASGSPEPRASATPGTPVSPSPTAGAGG